MNIDPRTVEGFGKEWAAFDQRGLSESERHELFAEYFGVFPQENLNPDAVGFDLGCGSGRWARLVAPRVKQLHCIDASAEALDVARTNLKNLDNCEFHHASVDEIPLPENSMDFGYCLGVLHHVPDTEEGIRAAVRLLKPGTPFLLYLYYNFENRNLAFRMLWKMSDFLRGVIARLPFSARRGVTSIIAAFVYMPLSRLARLLDRAGRDVDGFPLAYYRNRSFYTMRTDALDRFGTQLEKRFSRREIATMMEASGLTDIRFSDQPPYWCAVGWRGRS